jgi:hypothetical protein
VRVPRVEKYDSDWADVLDHAQALIAGGERNLARALRQLEAYWRNIKPQPRTGTAYGKLVTLPHAALIGGRRDVLMEALLAACTAKTGMVVELGSGWGHNLLNLWLYGGPKVPYFSLEPGLAGRQCAELVAGLDPELRLTSLPIDLENARYDLPTGHEHVVVFTSHSIEQITELPRETLTSLFELGRSVTVVHFEPVGWQIEENEANGASREHSLRGRYNRNLWPLLNELAAEGELSIDTAAPDLFGHKKQNASTLLVWHR